MDLKRRYGRLGKKLSLNLRGRCLEKPIINVERKETEEQSE